MMHAFFLLLSLLPLSRVDGDSRDRHHFVTTYYDMSAWRHSRRDYVRGVVQAAEYLTARGCGYTMYCLGAKNDPSYNCTDFANALRHLPSAIYSVGPRGTHLCNMSGNTIKIRTLKDPRKQKKRIEYRIAEVLSRKEHLLGLDTSSIACKLHEDYDDVKFFLCDEYNDQSDSNVGYSRVSKVWYLRPNVTRVSFVLGSFTNTQQYEGNLVEFIKWGLDAHLVIKCGAKQAVVAENLFHVATNKDAVWSPPEDIRAEWMDGLLALSDGSTNDDIIVHLQNKCVFTQDVLIHLSKSIGGGLSVSLKGGDASRLATMDKKKFTISEKWIKSLTDACDKGVCVP